MLPVFRGCIWFCLKEEEDSEFSILPLMFIIGLGVFTIGPAEDDLGPVLDGDRHRLTVIRWSFLFTVTAKQHERHHHGQRPGSSLSPCYVMFWTTCLISYLWASKATLTSFCNRAKLKSKLISNVTWNKVTQHSLLLLLLLRSYTQEYFISFYFNIAPQTQQQQQSSQHPSEQPRQPQAYKQS